MNNTDLGDYLFTIYEIIRLRLQEGSFTKREVESFCDLLLQSVKEKEEN